MAQRKQAGSPIPASDLAHSWPTRDDPLHVYGRYHFTSKVTVLTGSSPHGQGMETTFAQIAADELGVPFEDVELEATAYWEPMAYTYPCSASVAVVDLDKETGAR